MRRVVVLLALALALPGSAEAARFAVGLEPGADRARVAAGVGAKTGGRVQSLAPFALVLEGRTAAGALQVPGVAYVERMGNRGRRLAFALTDPMAPRQWHLGAVRAFDAWPQRPVFSVPGLRVAIIDSGVDAGHPELVGRIAAHRSFVGGSALRDRHGHGTFIAGLMAAGLNNGQGIAGMAFPAQLLVAKVVRADGVVPLEAEARAIRWAVDRGATVINLSLGGMRHPLDPTRDSFSPLEASAVDYAVRKGALVVAAVGNGDQAPEQPWMYASYPAALPHVLGVSAISRDGSVPAFSNRDPFFNDIAAPGDELFSLLPRNVTAVRPTCELQGYSDCGPQEYRQARGTSFAAAITSAAAALVRASWPNLRAEQIVGLMQRSAADMTAETGCRRCIPGRDPVSGWGRLDVAAAVNWAGRLPVGRDKLEPNDDAGGRARTIVPARQGGIFATLDYWDDQNDVYAVRLRRGGRLAVTVTGKLGANVDVYVWRPGTRRLGRRTSGMVVARSARPDARRPDFARVLRAARAGIYYVQVTLAEPGSGPYVLRIVRR